MRRFFAILMCLPLLVLLLSGCNASEINETQEIIGQEEKSFFKAEIIEMTQSSLIVRPLDEYPEARSSDKISVADWFPENTVKVGDVIGISYDGAILESYPAQLSKIYSMEYYDEHGCATVVIE